MSPNQITGLMRDAGFNDLPEIDFWYPSFKYFANLVAQLERERIATSIERLPFGDTAASFAIYVRELKDE